MGGLPDNLQGHSWIFHPSVSEKGQSLTWNLFISQLIWTLKKILGRCCSDSNKSLKKMQVGYSLVKVAMNHCGDTQPRVIFFELDFALLILGNNMKHQVI